MQSLVPVGGLQKYLQFIFAFKFFRSKTNGLVSETISHGANNFHITNILDAGAHE